MLASEERSAEPTRRFGVASATPERSVRPGFRSNQDARPITRRLMSARGMAEVPVAGGHERTRGAQIAGRKIDRRGGLTRPDRVWVDFRLPPQALFLTRGGGSGASSDRHLGPDVGVILTRLPCNQGRRCLRHPAANVPPVRRAVPVRLPRAGHAGGDQHDHEAVWAELRGPTAPSSRPRLARPIAHSPRDTSSPVVLMWSVWFPPSKDGSHED